MDRDNVPQLDADRRAVIHRVEDVKRLSREQLDELPFGVIQVEPDGRVVGYNAAEAKLANKNPRDVIGKNFFADVAPCTNVQDFAGRFRRGIERGRLQETFPYRFAFESGPVSVMVTFHYEEPEAHAWIFIDAFESN